MSEQGDWHLVVRAQNGDRAAFAELIGRYQTPLVNFCSRMIGSQEDAEELAQDSFMRIYRHLGRLTPRGARFSTVLFGIARNLTLNTIRNAKRRGRDAAQALNQGAPVPDNTYRPDRDAQVGELGAMIERAIAQLSPEHREVVLLRDIEGLDYAAIARICKCRKGTVKSRLARAREQLRARIVELEGE